MIAKSITVLFVASVLTGCVSHAPLNLSKGDNVIYIEESQRFPATVLLAKVQKPDTAPISESSIPPELIGAVVDKALQAIPEAIEANKEIKINTGSVDRKIVIRGYTGQLDQVSGILQVSGASIISP